MLLYSTLLCKKIARAPGGYKKFKLTKVGGQNRIDPYFQVNEEHLEYARTFFVQMKFMLTCQNERIEERRTSEGF